LTLPAHHNEGVRVCGQIAWRPSYLSCRAERSVAETSGIGHDVPSARGQTPRMHCTAMAQYLVFWGSSGFCVLFRLGLEGFGSGSAGCTSRLASLLGALPPNPRHLALWANSMRNALGLSLAVDRRCRHSGGAAVEDRALPAGHPERRGSPVAWAMPSLWRRRLAPEPCCWRKAENARGPGTASPVIGHCATQKCAKTG